ncbi:MAG: carbon-nitrogen hydrolase family protein [Nocardioidaceae bacterium]
MRVVLPRLANNGVAGRLDELLARTRTLAIDLSPDLVVYPELAVTGYPALADPKADEAALIAIAEPVPGPTTEAFAELAQRATCAVVYGLCESDGNRRYNTVIWSDPDGSVTAYRKIHLTEGERRHFTAGEIAVVAPGSVFGKVGLSSCYDKAFPQVYQRQRERGARLSVIASAWASHAGTPGFSGDVWADQSELFDRARAAETGMVVVSTNYEGPRAPGSQASFCGGRRVVDGLGRTVPPNLTTEAALVWDVDLDAAGRAVVELHGDDFFERDRRPVG